MQNTWKQITLICKEQSETSSITGVTNGWMNMVAKVVIILRYSVYLSKIAIWESNL
jgi:hypothetical protein